MRRNVAERTEPLLTLPYLQKTKLTLFVLLLNFVDCILPCHRNTFKILLDVILRKSMNSSLKFVMLVQYKLFNVYILEYNYF